jgi:hypothetical protein
MIFRCHHFIIPFLLLLYFITKKKNILDTICWPFRVSPIAERISRSRICKDRLHMGHTSQTTKHSSFHLLEMKDLCV